MYLGNLILIKMPNFIGQWINEFIFILYRKLPMSQYDDVENYINSLEITFQFYKDFSELIVENQNLINEINLISYLSKQSNQIYTHDLQYI